MQLYTRSDVYTKMQLYTRSDVYTKMQLYTRSDVYTNSERKTMQLEIFFYCKINNPITANLFSFAVVV